MDKTGNYLLKNKIKLKKNNPAGALSKMCTNVSKTIIGTQINLRATTINTLFGSNTQLTGTLTVVGLDSGARLTLPITINKI